MDTYERLFNKTADYSNSFFPIIEFLNDIKNNKDENFNKESAYNDLEMIFDTFMEYHNEVEKYKMLEKEIGCPLEVRCKLCDGTIIYDEDGKAMGVEHIGEHDFCAYLIGGPYMPRLMYLKGYKKSWWLKADRSE